MNFISNNKGISAQRNKQWNENKQLYIQILINEMN